MSQESDTAWASVAAPRAARARGRAHGRTCALCRVRRRVLAGLCGLLVAAAPRAAQPQSTAPPTRTVSAGPQYARGSLHRWLFGSDYRKLWTTPVSAEVLDLHQFGGGLTPSFRVGGLQTKGLAFKGADGRDYTFRGIAKDLSEILPENMLGTIAERMVQDQGAGQHPAGALVADPVMEAAGVLHAETRLVVLPDDPALGEFRADFAGTLGTIAEFPGAVSDKNPGFHGATEILKHQPMYARLQASAADRVDARAFLRARLVDLLIGDWDRHRDQWRWAKLPESDLWQPIADDRDQAFCRYEGLVLGGVRDRQPILQDYGPHYNSIPGLTYNGREQDRILLASLERSEWRAIATDVQSRITDDVIQRAVARLPAEYQAIDGARLASDLRSRRDGLVDAADRFYLQLADKLDVQLTDQAEQVTVRRLDGGDVELAATQTGEGAPYFRRVVHPKETSEVRLYLRGGDDHVVTTGAPQAPLVRVIGGDGQDGVDDSAGGGTRLYDSAQSELRAGPRSKLEAHPYTPPPPPPRSPWIPPRDWGRETYTLPIFGYSSDFGPVVGAGVEIFNYGFRKHPFASRHALRGAWAFGAGAGRLEYRGEYRRENSRAFTTLIVYASGVELLHFYGFGNETSSDHPDDFYKVFQQQYGATPAIALPLAPALYLTLGPTVKYATTDRGRDQLVNELQPYGFEDFGQAGVTAALAFESRRPRQDFPANSLLPVNGYPVGGARFELQGSIYPDLWSVERTYGTVEGELAGYHTLIKRVTLAVRAGGRQVYGDAPFQDAASIGGVSTVRGFPRGRYSGDAALYSAAEARLFVSRYYFILPGEWGLFGSGDTGRVWVDDEQSDVWHSAWGGGLWFAYLDRKNTFSVGAAKGPAGTQIYARAGFAF